MFDRVKVLCMFLHRHSAIYFAGFADFAPFLTDDIRCQQKLVYPKLLDIATVSYKVVGAISLLLSLSTVVLSTIK